MKKIKTVKSAQLLSGRSQVRILSGTNFSPCVPQGRGLRKIMMSPKVPNQHLSLYEKKVSTQVFLGHSPVPVYN